MEKKKKRRIVLSVIAVLIIGFLVWFVPFAVKNAHYLSLPSVTKEQLNELPISGIYNLMIVAHPDDEFMWGGGHLLEGLWFVVVITNGDNEVRKAEFEEMMEKTGSVGLILSYPDKIGKKRSNWKFWEKDILADLCTIINYKQWNCIVTHNAEGEYGHQHHIYTHRYVTEICKERGVTYSLWYFGTYYKKGTVPEDLPHISSAGQNNTLSVKQSLASVYKSQQRTIEKLSHMLPYENWEPYSEQ